MVTSRLILLAAAACVSASVTPDGLLHMGLMKRQSLSPGSPAYNCHDNCGQAIIIVKAGGDVCSNNAFTTDYKYCLQCSGPDNQDIWKYYGSSLTSAASGCGLSTTPLSGTQPDVPAAIAAPSSASAAASTAAPSSAAAASSAAVTSAAQSSAAGSSAAASPAASSSAAAAASSSVRASVAASTTSAAASGSASGSVSGSASGSSARASTTGTPVVSGTGSAASGNRTATFTSSVPQQTVNAAVDLASNPGMLGAVVAGLLVGLL